jgi:hypothetical protein
MPELEEKKEQVVTYARFKEGDTSSADFNRKLNQYVFENLPLSPEQKLEFRSLCLADRGSDDMSIPSVEST